MDMRQYKKHLTSREVAYVTGVQYRDVLALFKHSSLHDKVYTVGQVKIIETVELLRYAENREHNVTIDEDKLQAVSRARDVA